MNNTDPASTPIVSAITIEHESINVPPVTHRGMAVDYGLLRRVYGLYLTQPGGIWSRDRQIRRTHDDLPVSPTST